MCTRTKMSSWPVLGCPLTVWTSLQPLNVRTFCSTAIFPQKLKNHHLLGAVPLSPSYLLIKSTSCLQLYSLLVLCNLDVSTGHVLIVVDSSWQVTAGPVLWANPHQPCHSTIWAVSPLGKWHSRELLCFSLHRKDKNQNESGTFLFSFSGSSDLEGERWWLF